MKTFAQAGFKKAGFIFLLIWEYPKVCVNGFV